MRGGHGAMDCNLTNPAILIKSVQDEDGAQLAAMSKRQTLVQ